MIISGQIPKLSAYEEVTIQTDFLSWRTRFAIWHGGVCDYGFVHRQKCLNMTGMPHARRKAPLNHILNVVACGYLFSSISSGDFLLIP